MLLILIGQTGSSLEFVACANCFRLQVAYGQANSKAAKVSL